MKMIVLIPAYNPGSSLIRVVSALYDENADIVIVNDGSDTAYQPVFDQCSVTAVLIDQAHNCGKGAALKRGMQWIKENSDPEDIVITADADGQHDPEDILHCGEIAALNRDSMILGVRDFNGKDVPFKSHWGNRITCTVFYLFTGVHLSDTQTGLRAFSVQMLPKMLAVKGERYEYETEQLLALIRDHTPIKEVPIKTIYEDGNHSSHFHVLRDSWSIYRQLFHFAASSFTSFLIDYALFFCLSMVMTGNSGTILANITARIFSAAFNYEVNRKVVFKDAQARRTSLWRYILLAASILAMNTCILSFFVAVLHWHAWAAKILTELILFLFSWTIQNRFVFNHHMKGEAHTTL